MKKHAFRSAFPDELELPLAPSTAVARVVNRPALPGGAHALASHED